MQSQRTNESTKAARTLRRLLDHNPELPRQTREALELAISLLEARAIDGEEDRS